MYVSIQYLRALAVISVLVLHSQFAFDGPLVHIPLFSDYGWVGVRLFFVISGFVIAGSIVRAPDLRTYLFKRYFRVFPLYFLVSLSTIVVAILVGHNVFMFAKSDSGAVTFDIDSIYVVKSLLIFPQDPWPIFAVGWSLEFEIIFYAVFGIAYFAFGPLIARMFVFSLALIGLSGIAGFNHVAHPFMFYFLCGVVTHDLYRRAPEGSLLLAQILLIPSTAAWIVLLYGDYGLGQSPFIVISALSFAAMIRTGLRLESRMTDNGLMILLGNASYSIYLVHWIPARTVGNFHLDFGLLGNEAARLALILFSLWISVLVYRWVETPLSRLLKGPPLHRRNGIAVLPSGCRAAAQRSRQ